MAKKHSPTNVTLDSTKAISPDAKSPPAPEPKPAGAESAPTITAPIVPPPPPPEAPAKTATQAASPPPPFGMHIELPAEFEKMLSEQKPASAPVAKPVENAPVTQAKAMAELKIESQATTPPAGKSESNGPKSSTSAQSQPVQPSVLPTPAKPAPANVPRPTPVASAPKAVAGAAKLATPKTITQPVKPKAERMSEVKFISQVPALQEEKVEKAEQPTSSAPDAPPAPPHKSINPMYVVMISPELAPVAKVGGLGDVVYGLAREMEIRGNTVEIILPKYNNMRYDHIWGLTKVYENLWVPWYGGAINTSVWFGFVHGRKCFFIESHSQDNFFNRGAYYGQNDDVMRFAFFCRAALEFMLKTNKHPEVIHCHDWQTALVPVLLYEMYQRLGMRHSRVCYTIHNFRHQGVTGGQVLQATGLNRPEYYFHYDRMRDNKNASALNLMKAGIVYSNFTTTVSPRHAWEAKDAGQGDSLEPTLHTHHTKFGGVLNGLDYDQFNPDTDPYIPAHFNIATIDKKYENKKALRDRFWLADSEKPIIAFIGRLDQQKGLELVRHSIFYALNNRAQFVLLGSSPERAINDHFLGLKHHLNNSPDCHLEIGYHEELAHLIYAGADMMVVPSRYEPCGLTQLISFRYGTVPIVRSVGGLADTVFDKDHSARPLHERNGYVFEHADNAGVESALHRAIGCYYEFPDHWRNLMVNGMNSDYSWNHPGQHYLNIYDYIRDK